MLSITLHYLVLTIIIPRRGEQLYSSPSPILNQACKTKQTAFLLMACKVLGVQSGGKHRETTSNWSRSDICALC